MARRKSITGIKRRSKLPKSTPSASSSSLPSHAASAPHSGTASSEKQSPILPSRQEIEDHKKKLTGNAVTDQSRVHRRRIGNRPHGVDALLSPQLRYISQDVVRSKWKVIPKSTEDKIKELFRSIERPVLASYAGDLRKIDAQQAIASIAGTLQKCLPRMSFPPRTKQIDFDYEKLLQENRLLEHRLDRAGQSIRILTDETEKERSSSILDRQNLEDFEDNGQTDEDLIESQANKESPKLENRTKRDSPRRIAMEWPEIRQPQSSEQTRLDVDIRRFLTRMKSRKRHIENLHGQ